MLTEAGKQEIMRGVASVLGWAVKDDSGMLYLSGPDGLCLYFHADGYDRLRIHCSAFAKGLVNATSLWECLPYEQRQWGAKVLKITVTTSKTPKQIAGDITRRLLPTATKLNAIRLQEDQKTRDAQAGRAALISLVLGEMPSIRELHPFTYQEQKGENGFTGTIGGTYIKAQSNYRGSSVKMELDLTPEAAVLVAKVLQSIA